MVDADDLRSTAQEAHTAKPAPGVNLCHAEPNEAGGMAQNDHRLMFCDGCEADWWGDEDCACSCQPGDPNYEKWRVWADTNMTPEEWRFMREQDAREHFDG